MNLAPAFLRAFAVLGSVLVIYFSIRVIAKIIDLLNRWGTGNWDIEE